MAPSVDENAMSGPAPNKPVMRRMTPNLANIFIINASLNGPGAPHTDDGQPLGGWAEELDCVQSALGVDPDHLQRDLEMLQGA